MSQANYCMEPDELEALGNNENIHQEKSLMPGFEIILAIFTLMLVLLWKSHKKG